MGRRGVRQAIQTKGIYVAIAGLMLAGWAQAQTYTRTESIAYYDDLGRWVVGQTAKVTCVAPVAAVPTGCGAIGTVLSETAYDASTALPVRHYAFGKLQHTLAYNPDGTLTSVTDGRGNKTTLTNWKRGIPQAITYADGRADSAGVNDDGTIAWVTNEAGAKTCYAYDAMGRISQITYPSEAQAGVCDNSAWTPTTQSFQSISTTEYGLPPGHWKQSVATGNGLRITYFDALWRPVVEERLDAASATATRSVMVKRYDLGGQLAFASFPRESLGSFADNTLQGTHTTYDALNRPLRVEQDSELGLLVTRTEYLPGFQTRVTNPRGFATVTSYMVYDQPTTDWPVWMAHPTGAYTHITRDVFGKPTRLRRSNGSGPADGTVALDRSYAYNGQQELCHTAEPESGTTLYGYDAAGNLAWSASGLPAGIACDPDGNTATILARKATRTYDARNRLLTLSFPDGVGNQVWSYTPDGLPAQATTYNDPASGTPVTSSYTYNRRRLLVEESATQPGWYTWAIGYGFNSNGHLASVTHPGGEVVSSAPNALGQPTQAVSQFGTYAASVSYYPNGALRQFTYGNGLVHTLIQNARQLPERSRDAYGGTAVLDDSYDYDANGNVAAISDGATGQGQRGNRDMQYDGLDRLTSVASPMYGSQGAQYAYDVLDNLTRVQVGGAAARDHWYCYDPGTWRLTNIKTGGCGGATVVGLGYDPQGNLFIKNGQGYTFNFDNRLRAVVGKEYYRYDVHGRRVLAWELGTDSILSLYGQDGVLRYQQDLRRGLVFNYVYLGGSLVGIRETPMGTANHVFKYQHTDALGSPVAVTDQARNVIQRSEYEPYGRLLNRPLTDGPGYTGHVSDAVTGLVYMQQRYYDPDVGIFLSVDPVDVNGQNGWNFCRYCYGLDNPYKFKDPDGRQVKQLIQEILRAVIPAPPPGGQKNSQPEAKDLDSGDGSRSERDTRRTRDDEPVKEKQQDEDRWYGENPKEASGRVNTDRGTDPYEDWKDRTGGKDKVDESGQRIGPRGERLRIGRDGRPRIELPVEATGKRKHETVHYPTYPPISRGAND